MTDSRASRGRRWATSWLFDRGGLLVLVVLATYLCLAPSHIVDGDNAELSSVGAVGGRPHPSGYPAYVLWLRATAWLPGSTPAHTAAIATALLGALLILVLHAACRAWGARPFAATLATALYAAGPVVLRMHTEAEVFALNGLVIALVLWLSAANGPVRGVARGALLGLIAGIGMGNHLTCVLIAPVGILGVIRAVREQPRQKALPIVGAILGLAVGLATYAYLVVADGPASFGQIDRLGDVLDFFLRTDYGGPGAFVPNGTVVAPSHNLGALAATVGRSWLWLPALAGLAMLGLGAWRGSGPEGETRWAWRVLAASWILAGPLLVYRFNIEPAGLGLYVCQRFHLLPAELLAIPVAVVVDRAVRASGRDLAPWIGIALGCLMFLGLVGAALPRLRAAHSPAMELGARNQLAVLPDNAVIVTNSEDLCLAMHYLQTAEHVRPDVELVCWILTSRDWYRTRLARHGLAPVGAFALQTSVEEADAILAKGHPLFVDRSRTTLLENRPSYPYGTLTRILPRGSEPPALREIVAKNQELYAKFDLDYPRPGRDDDYATMAHKRYAATWVTLAAALDQAGDHQTSVEALELARQLAPAQDDE